MVPRTEGYTYDVGVWDLTIVQGPFSVAPCPTLKFTIRDFCIAVPPASGGGGAGASEVPAATSSSAAVWISRSKNPHTSTCVHRHTVFPPTPLSLCDPVSLLGPITKLARIMIQGGGGGCKGQGASHTHPPGSYAGQEAQLGLGNHV
jgi:hypothetical protein